VLTNVAEFEGFAVAGQHLLAESGVFRVLEARVGGD
jgi:hypothetical protein